MEWAREKAYRARRAEILGQDMERAIAGVDKEAFKSAYETACRYMNKRERDRYYIRFLAAMAEERRRNE